MVTSAGGSCPLDTGICHGVDRSLAQAHRTCSRSRSYESPSTGEHGAVWIARCSVRIARWLGVDRTVSRCRPHPGSMGTVHGSMRIASRFSEDRAPVHTAPCQRPHTIPRGFLVLRALLPTSCLGVPHCPTRRAIDPASPHGCDPSLPLPLALLRPVHTGPSFLYIGRLVLEQRTGEEVVRTEEAQGLLASSGRRILGAGAKLGEAGEGAIEGGYRGGLSREATESRARAP
jgi:hypothetical protein